MDFENRGGRRITYRGRWLPCQVLSLILPVTKGPSVAPYMYTLCQLLGCGIGTSCYMIPTYHTNTPFLAQSRGLQAS